MGWGGGIIKTYLVFVPRVWTIAPKPFVNCRAEVTGKRWGLCAPRWLPTSWELGNQPSAQRAVTFTYLSLHLRNEMMKTTKEKAQGWALPGWGRPKVAEALDAPSGLLVQGPAAREVYRSQRTGG